MSKRAETLVWDRSVVGKTDLLLLVKIADLCDDDGRNAWIETPAMAKAIRASERGALYVLQRLERAGEIEIEWNRDGRFIEFRGGRRFTPKWFIHVRCVCAWDEYQQSAKIADSEHAKFQRGRPRRKSAKIADSAGSRNPQSFPSNPNPSSEKSEKTRIAYKEGSVTDPLIEQEQGAAPPISPEKARRTDDEGDPNFRVILKSAHDAIDVDGIGASLSQLTATTRSICHLRHLNVGDSNELVNKAIDSALWQRTHPLPEARA